MEKISNIVRGSARVASTDLKNASAVRPGAPSYGRPVGESQPVAERVSTTASRAVALHNELIENKKTSHKTEMAAQLADQFFSTRLKRPNDEDDGVPQVGPGRGASPRGSEDDEDLALKGEAPAGDDAPPLGFTPRGSYVDIRA